MKVFLSLAMLFWSALVFGETYSGLYFEHVNNNDGLISDEVNSSSQDANGFMWFATSEGIARYDGYEFRSYKSHPHLGMLYGNDVREIAWGIDGSMYIGAGNGFYAFSHRLEPILDFVVQAMQGTLINDIYCAEDGKIYLSTENGLYIIDPGQEKLHKVEGINHAQKAVGDSKGQIWVGSWGKGILKLDADGLSFKSFPFFQGIDEGNADNAVKSLLVDSNGFLWVGTWEAGLYVLDISADKEVKIVKSFAHKADDPNSIPGNIILDIEEDKYHGIWVGTPYGTAVIQYPLTQKCKITRYEYSESAGKISSNVVRDIFCDSSNLLWFSTKGGGVNKMHLERNKFDLFKIPELDPQKRTQSVYSFEIDHKGRLLAGVLSLGFVVYDMEKERFFHYSQLPEFKAIASRVDLNTVNSFLWDKDSVLWMGTRYNGIITFNPRNGVIDVINSETTNNAFKGRSVNVLFLDEDGSVWAGTWNGLNHIITIEGQQRIITNTTFLDQYNEAVENVNVTGVLNDNKGNLLIATLTNGMFTVSPQKEKPIATEWEVVKVPYKIISAFKDTGQRIWIGTKGNGIKLIEKNSSEIISPLAEGNVFGDVVFGINQDEYGSIWLTTNKGLLKLWFQQQIPQTERFLYRDGLQGNIFIPRAFFKDKKGHFYVGGNHGFNIFNPLKVNGNYSKAPVVITDIMVGGEHVPYYQGETNTLRLNHIQNNFSVTFSALGYLHPEANQYAYMVEGIDNDWKYVTSKMRSANYSNLLAGDYVLKIKGSNGQGVWNDTFLSLNIHVKQAPYKTWWAILIYLVFVIGIIWAIFLQRLRIERIKQDYQLQLIKRSKSEKLNQFKLRFFTNISHELLTPLTILSAAIENGLKERKFSMNNQLLMQRNVNGLLRLIRQLLTFRKLETGNMTLKLVKGDLSSFVTNCVDDFKLLSQKQDIQFKVDVEPNIMGVFDKEKMEIILRNLLSNAFRYTNDGGEIVFSLRRQANLEVIELIVKDTGIGISEESLPHLFDRFYRDESNKENDKSGMGIGLSLTNNLVGLMNGKINVESALGEGSTFTVALPIGEEAFVKAESFIADEESLKNITIPIEEESAEPEEEDMEVGQNSGYTILVADDNDDFRFTVKESLKKSFNILEARNGQEAFNIAMSDDVDLIVSDVMMPNLSGKELCKAVKSNINISHIPIILLSAKVGDQNKLQGYEAGADSYLEKPVSLKVLKVRINGLLAIREKFKNKVSSDFNLEPENTSITPLDEKFIMKAKAFVEENLSDSEFSVKSLANELGVSNSMLYRKIRSLVGLAPNEFIRNIRLKRAAQMLKNKSFTISEVAFNCGFNDLGYFGVCFKKRFGKTPTGYQTGEKE